MMDALSYALTAVAVILFLSALFSIWDLIDIFGLRLNRLEVCIIACVFLGLAKWCSVN